MNQKNSKSISDSSQKSLFSNMSRSRKKISFSRIATFLRCPYEYNYTFINKIENMKRCGPKIGLGISLHAALRDFYKIESVDDRTLNTLLLLLKRNWSTRDFKNTHEEQTLIEKAQNILTKFYLHNDHTKTPSYIEQRFEAKVNDLIFVGIIDRIDKIEDNYYEIIDYKLEDYLKSEIDNLQMTFYYIGCKYGLGIDIKTFTFYILETNRKKNVVLTPGEIEKNMRRIQSCITEIDSTNVFIPKINALCENCGIKSTCPAHRDTNI
jgi:ATP-dependent helicase/DNAse subunit B